MFKRILVVLDPARNLGPARQYAVEIVKRWGSSVVAMYTAFEEAEPFQAAHATGPNPQKFVGKETVKDFCDQLEREAGEDVDFTTVVGEGPFEVAIPEIAAKEKVDLLVLGSFHAKMARALVGSDTERLIEYAPCSVLLVRRISQLPEPGSVLAFAHDSIRVSNAVVKRIAHLSRDLGTVVHPVLGVPTKGVEDGKRTASRIMKGLAEEGVMTKDPQVLTSRWILGPHGVVHRAVSGLHPSIGVMTRIIGRTKGNASHWLVHEFVADTPCPMLFLK